MTWIANHRPGHRQMISPVPGTRPSIRDVMQQKLEEARKAGDPERMQYIITFYED